MSDSKSNMMPSPESLGGMGDTDDLVVVGMVDQSGEGGIGVIGSDSGMTIQPRRPAREDSTEGTAKNVRRKAVDGDVSPAVTVGRHWGVAPEAGGTTREVPRQTPRTATKREHGANGDDIPKKRSKGASIVPKILLALLVVFLGALVGVWAYGRSHYSEHLFPGRMVDGVNVSNMTAAEAREATSVENWSFVVTDGEERYELGAEDVGFETEEVDFDKIIAEQDVNAWFLHVIAPEKNESIRKSTYDSDAVTKSVQALPCMSDSREQPVDATVEKAEDGLSYHIVQEKEGNVVKDGVIEDAVEQSLAEGRNGEIDLEKADAYVHPLVYADDESLVSAVDTANKWMKTSITYDIDGLESVETLGPETISQWVSVVREEPAVEDKANEGEGDQPEASTDGQDGTDEGSGESSDDKGDVSGDASARQVFGRDAQGDQARFWQVSESTTADGIQDKRKNDDRPKPTFKATFDDDGLRGWLAGIGDEYDTAGKPKTITTPNGAVKEVNGGGSYGWITDEASEFDAIKASLDAGETTHREFAMKQRAALPKGQNEWGNTYIEIDLSEQHLWYIRNGEVILSYGVITGKRGYETPTMVSQVYAKQTDVTLVSPWKDPKTGEPTYKTHIDVGLVISDDYQVLCHDAPWQPSSGFGSPSYHWGGGSHGCCNMRAGDCWELYNTASVGDPVIVHY